ncbi:uncharacterized protein K02A2.6-like [Lineus longissimus]|uniref:uncharacterized protein K02A2.6-like n=1 Tax=Lineus longissimus TaxID=88925 RepID=UPI00315D2225
MPYPVPTRPWEIIGTDLFEWHETQYLISVDSYSGWFEINSMQDTCTKNLIQKLKVHFSRFGIPDLVISDEGPQYQSHEFAKFAETWGFKRTTSSPYFHSSNGLAENAVKAAKRLLEKSYKDGADFYFNLLNWRNTPRDSVLGSQAQRNLSRRTRTGLPTAETLLKPSVIDPAKVHNRLTDLRKMQKTFVDAKAKPLDPLEPGDNVRMQTKKGYDRTAVVVKESEQPRSFIVKASDTGLEYRRNRQHLLKTPNAKKVTFQQGEENETVTASVPHVPDLNAPNMKTLPPGKTTVAANVAPPQPAIPQTAKQVVTRS